MSTKQLTLLLCILGAASTLNTYASKEAKTEERANAETELREEANEDQGKKGNYSWKRAACYAALTGVAFVAYYLLRTYVYGSFIEDNEGWTRYLAMAAYPAVMAVLGMIMAKVDSMVCAADKE